MNKKQLPWLASLWLAAAITAQAEQWGEWSSSHDLSAPGVSDAELMQTDIAMPSGADLAAGTQLAGTPFLGLDTDPGAAPLPPSGDDISVDVPQDFAVDPDNAFPIDVGTIELNEDGIPVDLAG
ncbi:hypothetical protein CHH28_07745 [Bacterioplanes sanyensis]|uniref:Uncharacterized protein n=1 Tax=Bacterioplanes sanyensis TaxID=1249553 RepID=A0A222FK14_9GAMM|nr:hypothetical protein [Bacterioplanes sanyensis]ASP38573.1 hypothetical protein CHH28_07745 [Bacterioplanes sanyensis]